MGRGSRTLSSIRERRFSASRSWIEGWWTRIAFMVLRLVYEALWCKKRWWRLLLRLYFWRWECIFDGFATWFFIGSRSGVEKGCLVGIEVFWFICLLRVLLLLY
ncbi:hypothetical protein GGS21DRAFT_517234 [Xylaria nigripes]|nr:hypothetical protein GGS21DRAFT_517234 [Xylaria nigripes]